MFTLQPPVIFRLKHSLRAASFTFTHAPRDEDECHHLEPGVKLSCCKAPAQPSYLLISSGRGQGVRQGRAAARRHCGAQGPTYRQSCEPRCCVISSQSVARGRCRSHTMVLCSSWEDPIHTHKHANTHTQKDTNTLAKLCTVEYKMHVLIESILPRKGGKLACAHTHSCTHTLSQHKMERLSGIKIHIDRVESHKHPGSLCMSNIPLGADHSVLLPCFKIQLLKRFKSFGGIKHTHTYTHKHAYSRSVEVLLLTK